MNVQTRCRRRRVDGVEDELRARVQPVDGRVGVVGRLAVGHIARVEDLVAPVGDDLRRPTVAAADVAEQLPQRPTGTCRHGRGRVGTCESVRRIAAVSSMSAARTST